MSDGCRWRGEQSSRPGSSRGRSRRIVGVEWRGSHDAACTRDRATIVAVRSPIARSGVLRSADARGAGRVVGEDDTRRVKASTSRRRRAAVAASMPHVEVSARASSVSVRPCPAPEAATGCWRARAFGGVLHIRGRDRGAERCCSAGPSGTPAPDESSRDAAASRSCVGTRRSGADPARRVPTAPRRAPRRASRKISRSAGTASRSSSRVPTRVGTGVVTIACVPLPTRSVQHHTSESDRRSAVPVDGVRLEHAARARPAGAARRRPRVRSSPCPRRPGR